MLRLLAQITPPSERRVELRGRVGALLEVGTGFHPELTGRDNVFLSAAILGKPRSEIRARLDDIVEFAGVGEFLDTPVKRYSTGMYLRLAFAVAARLEPDIRLVDEVLAVGDAEFQRKCLARMAEASAGWRTVVFVSPHMAQVKRLCDRIIVLDRGRIVVDGPAAVVVPAYLQSGFGTTAERRWDSPDEAPGDHVARLKSVRVLVGGHPSPEVDVTDRVDVEVEYWRLGAGDERTLWRSSSSCRTASACSRPARHCRPAECNGARGGRPAVVSGSCGRRAKYPPTSSQKVS